MKTKGVKVEVFGRFGFRKFYAVGDHIESNASGCRLSIKISDYMGDIGDSSKLFTLFTYFPKNSDRVKITTLV